MATDIFTLVGSKSPLNIDELCRICGTVDSQLLRIFNGDGEEHNLFEKIDKHLPFLKVSENELLPSKVCYQCASVIISWNDLCDTSIRANILMKSVLLGENNDIPQESIDIHDEIKIPMSCNLDSQIIDFHNDVSDLCNNRNEDDLLEDNFLITAYTPDDIESEQLDANDLENEQLNVNDLDSEQLNVNEVFDITVTEEEQQEIDLLNNDMAELLPHILGTKNHAEILYNNIEEIEVPSLTELKKHYICRYCDEIFNTREERTNHTKLLKVLNNFLNSSVSAPQDYDPSSEYGTSQGHSGTDVSVISGANMLISNNNEYEDNVESWFNYIRLHCLDTNQTIGNRSTTVRAEHAHRIEITYPPIINNKTVFWSKLFRKFLTEDSEIYFGCDSCSFSCTVNRKSFIMHCQARGCMIMKLICEYCGSYFQTKYALQKHRRFFHLPRPYRCHICLKGCIDQSQLDGHLRRNHKMHLKIYNKRKKHNICDYCNKTFTTKRSLKNHIENHGRIKQIKTYKCTVCDKIFHRNCDLIMHKRNHEQEHEYYECDICGKRCMRKNIIRDHLKFVHGNVASLVCELCGARVKRKSGMMKHLRSKHKKTITFPCENCQIDFMSRAELLRHSKCHTIYKCYDCRMKFDSKMALLNHRELYHYSVTYFKRRTRKSKDDII